MKRFLFASSFFAINATQSLSASGLDLEFYYGSRYIYLGGNQVALSKDAYAPFYNPAAMTSVESGTFALNSSTLIDQFSAPIGAANQQMKSEFQTNPLFYIGGVYKLMDRLALGLAVFPTALEGNKFSPVDFGAGSGLTQLSNLEQSNLLARIEIAPSLAVKVTPVFSVGLSYRISYTRYDKAGGAHFGSVGAKAASVDASLSGWDGKGLKLGAFVDNWRGLSLGLTYRVEVTPTLTGRANVATLGGRVADMSATQDVTIPAQLQAGLAYDFIPDTWMAAFTYEFTENSRISDSMTIESYASTFGLASDVVSTPINKRDGHSLHFGTEYTFHVDSQSKVRTGVGMTVASADTRKAFPNPLLAPGNLFRGYGVGGQYEIGKHTAGLSVNYQNNSITSETVDPTLTGRAFPGKYGLEVWFVVADYQLRF